MDQQTPRSTHASFHVRQASHIRFRNLVGTAPGILQVLRGSKRMQFGAVELTAGPGDFVLVPDHTPLVVENVPDAAGLYHARLLVLERGLFERAYAPLQTSLISRHSSFVLPGAEAASGLTACFDSLCDALDLTEPLPDAILAVRCQELVTWLASDGLILPPASAHSTAARIRDLLGTDLERDWTAALVADHLAMSEPTMRRRLEAEQTSFRDLLTECRMMAGLSLLQTTDMAVSTIAFAVGYDSPSRFASRFRQRFGATPSDIRHARPQQ